jgi:hypothetical protein
VRQAASAAAVSRTTPPQRVRGCRGCPCPAVRRRVGRRLERERNRAGAREARERRGKIETARGCRDQGA